MWAVLEIAPAHVSPFGFSEADFLTSGRRWQTAGKSPNGERLASYWAKARENSSPKTRAI